MGMTKQDEQYAADHRAEILIARARKIVWSNWREPLPPPADLIKCMAKFIHRVNR
jgi:hypothetical protein